MKIVSLLGFASLLAATACAAPTPDEERANVEENGPTKPATSPVSGCTPLPSPTGSLNPADAYCRFLGYAVDANGDCAFPDGTTCEPWAFFRGQCGVEHSFCALHGGTTSSKEENMGSWTGVYSVCSFADGRSCHDTDFATSCTCQ